MDFDTFSRRAESIVAGIPEEYLAGVVGIEVHRERQEHPQIPGFYTLGECGDDPVTRLSDPGEMRSRVHLYYGSFASLARTDPDFDWEGELRETILHEIRHHIEDRAGIRDLVDEDAEEEALARFYADERLPEGWYRSGERMERNLWRVGNDLFLEIDLRGDGLARARGETLRLIVLDEPFSVEIPEDFAPGELLSFEGDGLEGEDGTPGDLHLILSGH